MTAKFDFFRVACGDMTLIRLESGRSILIDCNIRKAADDPGDDTPDVAAQLKELLKRDANGRPYVDAMLLSHPDADHCTGLEHHFHLGKLADYPKDSGKIIIKEMWSSPIVFRRGLKKTHGLWPDAEAWTTEARRRVRQFETLGYCPADERILILGEDVDGKTDKLGAILVKVDAEWNLIDGQPDSTFEALLLAPKHADDDAEEETLTKNDSSTIVRFKLASGYVKDACRFLTGGDAEVAIWEKLWDRHRNNAEWALAYDLLLSPHHCSWHSLSWDSWSQLGEDAKVSADARSALGQARAGATIVASSKSICDDDSDPPCVRAEREYRSILKPGGGTFVCVGDDGPKPLAYDVEPGGLKLRTAKVAATVAAPYVVGRTPLDHG
jgi:hypothetical protein